MAQKGSKMATCMAQAWTTAPQQQLRGILRDRSSCERTICRSLFVICVPMKALIAYRTQYLDHPEKELAAQRLADLGFTTHDQAKECTYFDKPMDGG